jgi:hypothetical protein
VEEFSHVDLAPTLAHDGWRRNNSAICGDGNASQGGDEMRVATTSAINESDERLLIQGIQQNRTNRGKGLVGYYYENSKIHTKTPASVPAYVVNQSDCRRLGKREFNAGLSEYKS